MISGKLKSAKERREKLVKVNELPTTYAFDCRRILWGGEIKKSVWKVLLLIDQSVFYTQKQLRCKVFPKM